MSSFRRSCLIVARQITAGKHMTPEVEEFAKTLCERVRDAAIQSCDRELDPDRASPMAKRWRAVMPDSSAERLARMLIPDVVDETIAQLLLAIDQEVLNLTFCALNGATIDLSRHGRGELTGSYVGSGGWRATYSKERFVDDLTDLSSTKGPTNE